MSRTAEGADSVDGAEREAFREYVAGRSPALLRLDGNGRHIYRGPIDVGPSLPDK